MISMSRITFLGCLQFLNHYANVAVLTLCFVSPQLPFIPAAARQQERERRGGTMLLTMGSGIWLGGKTSAQPLTNWEQSMTTWAPFCKFNQVPRTPCSQMVAEALTQSRAWARRNRLLLRITGLGVGTLIASFGKGLQEDQKT